MVRNKKYIRGGSICVFWDGRVFRPKEFIELMKEVFPKDSIINSFSLH